MRLHDLLVTKAPVKKTLRCLLTLALLPITLGACSAVNPEPFEGFSSALLEIRTGTTVSLGEVVSQTRGREVGDIASDPRGFTKLRLDFPETHAWTYPADGPLFATLANRQVAAQQLTEAMADYGILLLEIASVDALSGDTIDTRVQSMNSSAMAVVSALGVVIPPQIVGFVADAALRLFKEAMEAQKGKRLTEALRENQPNIEAFSGLGSDLMGDISRDLQAEYVHAYDELMLEFRELIRDGASEEEKQDVVDAVLILNAQTAALLSVSAELARAYEQLPAAHEELATAATAKSPVLTQIRDFAARAGAARELLASFSAAAPTD